jgi:hypothetical protein
VAAATDLRDRRDPHRSLRTRSIARKYLTSNPTTQPASEPTHDRA